MEETREDPTSLGGISCLDMSASKSSRVPKDDSGNDQTTSFEGDMLDECLAEDQVE